MLKIVFAGLALGLLFIPSGFGRSSDGAQEALAKIFHEKFPSAQPLPQPKRYILEFGDEAAAKRFAEKLQGASVVRRWLRYVVIRVKSPLNQAAADKVFQENFRPSAMYEDGDISMFATSAIVNQACERRASTLDGPNQKRLEDFAQLNGPGICSQRKDCPATGISENWDLQQMNLDLMLEELKRLKLPEAGTRIAVVDSPIDARVSKKINAQIEWNQNLLGTARTNDGVGHGTFVASRIAMVAPRARIRSYSVNTSTGQEIDRSEMIQLLQKACADGFEVINMSLGEGIFGFTLPSELFSGAELKGIRDRGCLILQSSGNGHGKTDSLNKINYDAIKQVTKIGSIGMSGGRSEFSDGAQLSAVGERVRGLLPTKSFIATTRKNSAGLSCGGDPDVAILSGTSFSAPIDSGMAKWVFDILKTATNFQKFSPRQRSDFVELLLGLGSQSGKTDGFLTILIAGIVAKANPEKPLAMDEVRALVQRDARAREIIDSVPNADCYKIASCGDRAACVNKKRAALALQGAFERNEDAALSRDIFLTYHNQGDFELAFPFLGFSGMARAASGNADRQLLNWRALQLRAAKIQYLPDFLAYLKALEEDASSPISAIAHEKILLALLADDNSLPLKDRLEYFEAIVKNAPLTERNEQILMRLLEQAPGAVTDAALSAALNLVAGGESNAEFPAAMRALSHPAFGKISLFYGAQILKKIKNPEFAQKFFLEYLKNPNLSEQTIAMLLSSLSDSRLNRELKAKLTQIALSSPKVCSQTISRSGQSLANLLPDFDARKAAVESLMQRLASCTRDKFDQEISFMNLFESMDGLSHEKILNLLDLLLKSKMASQRVRAKIFFSKWIQDKTPEQKVEYWLRAMQSPALFSREAPIMGLELFVLLDSNSFSDSQIIQILRALPKEARGPKDILATHLKMQGLSESRSKAIMDAYTS